MKILIVRHAYAGDKEEFKKTGRSDALRPLTDEGRKEMRQVARGLKRIADPPQLIATSALLRAKETAAIVRKAFGKIPVLEIEQLAPNAAPAAIEVWLKKRKEDVLALIGHEPHLSKAIAWLCARQEQPFTDLKKGQSCMLDFDITEGRATILWSLKPAQLKRLGKSGR